MEISQVLVTGSDGYIGKRLCAYLLERSFSLTLADTGYFKNCGVSPLKVKDLFSFRDIRNLTEYDLEYIEAIVHLGGLSNDPLGILNPTATMEINTKATIQLAESAKKAGVERFIFSSSCSVYGGKGATDLGIDELGEVDPLTTYAKSKVEAEKELNKLASEHFQVIALRSATVYGASSKMRTDLVVNNLVGSALLFNEIRLNSDGTAWRPLIHIKDLCEVILRVLNLSNDELKESYTQVNVGSNSNNFKINEIAKVVADAMNCHLSYGSKPSKDSRSYKVNFDKLKKMLDWEPAVPLRIGVRELIDFYSENLLTVEDFNHRFVRTSWLKQQIEAGLVTL